MTALPNQQPLPVAGPTAAANPARLEGRAKRTNPLIWVVLLLGLVLMVAPFLWMVLGSFKPQGEFLRIPPTWLPEQPTLDNYQRLFDRLDFPRFFFNSVVVAAAVTIGNLIFSPMLGWALAKLRWRGKGFVMGLVLATLMLPAGATLIPLFVLMSTLGLVNTYPGLILPFVAGPLGRVPHASVLPGHPRRAHRGGPHRRRERGPDLLALAMPLAAPILATLGILTFLGSWNSFIYPLVMSPGARDVHAAGGARDVRDRPVPGRPRDAHGRLGRARRARAHRVRAHAALDHGGHRDDRTKG